MQLSNQQIQIISMLQDHNVIVNAVAGAGKTTCNLYIAKHYPNLNILLLTYNARLKSETRHKVLNMSLTNLEVHSYHSFCVKYYDRSCFTDYNIHKIIDNKDLIPITRFKFDLIILDESQDLTPLYYQLVCQISKDNLCQNAQWCIVGDQYQSIYDFNNADARMIIYADKLFNFNDLQWQNAQLSYSFRLTQPMSIFINKCMLGNCRINSDKLSDSKPRYIIADCFGNSFKKNAPNQNKTFKEVEYYLSMGYEYSDFFILAPSVRSATSPVRQLSNLLAQRQIAVFVPISDEEKLDDEVIAGKIVFSTFHQAKGLERKVVIVFNFDDSYFQFYKKDQDPTKCPNELYVATTRAIEHLTLFHHYQNEYLPFLNQVELANCCDVINYTRLKIMANTKSKNADTAVVDLIRHLPQTTLIQAHQYIQIINHKPVAQTIGIPIKTQQKFGCEPVSDINGTAIPAYFEYKLKNKITINQPKIFAADHKPKHESIKCLLDFDEKPQTEIKLLEYDDHCIKPPQLLEIANHWNAYTSGYIYKVKQIDNYNWLSEHQLQLCLKRLQTLGISSNAEFEKRVELENRSELSNRKLIGYIDCCDCSNIYEFKCVSKLEIEHYLQVAIYAYLNEPAKKFGDELTYRYYLYNILTDQLDQVLISVQKLHELIYFLIINKYFNNKKVNDSTFIKNMNNIKALVNKDMK